MLYGKSILPGMQKLTIMVGAHGYDIFPLSKPVLCRNMGSDAVPANRASFYAQLHRVVVGHTVVCEEGVKERCSANQVKTDVMAHIKKQKERLLFMGLEHLVCATVVLR